MGEWHACTQQFTRHTLITYIIMFFLAEAYLWLVDNLMPDTITDWQMEKASTLRGRPSGRALPAEL